ncbi:hypothetical protein ES677_05040 [Bizionia gelidisalsuginis]|uniref:Lipoprotein n=1 Tax=Bizionia gelidisalsuginis TaxID=291188 RepID=A0ABY3MCW2_9FLAO|nr:hypothetical protein [Bizionia gelidisalsuginis]TYC15710.1 hypothetical protein ES677_05040 [Bizionia gelidisalsuginis]
MKKRKCKQYLKLVMLLFGVTFVLSSCQKDDDIYLQESKTQETNLNVSIFRKKQLEKNSNLMRVINKTEKVVSKNKANKTVYNSYYDFTINTSYAKVIESNGLKNYTFGVYRTEDWMC